MISNIIYDILSLLLNKTIIVLNRMFLPAYANDSTSIEKKNMWHKVELGCDHAGRMPLLPRADVYSTNIKQDNTEVQLNKEPPTGVLVD